MNFAIAFVVALFFASAVLAQSSVAAAAKTLATPVPDANIVSNTIPSTPLETWEESDIGYNAQVALQAVLGQMASVSEAPAQADSTTGIPRASDVSSSQT